VLDALYLYFLSASARRTKVMRMQKRDPSNGRNNAGKRLSSIFIAVTMILASFVGLVSTTVATDYGTVHGFAKTDKNDPISGAIVHLSGTTDYNVTTNESGYFIFNHNVSIDSYTSEFFKYGPEGFQPIVGDSFELHTNETKWLNFTRDTQIYLQGQVKDHHNSTPIPGASIMVWKQGPCEGFDNGPYLTNVTGCFSVNASNAGPGGFQIEVSMDRYVGYVNWSLQLSEGETKDLGVIYLEPFFAFGHNATIRGRVTKVVGGVPVHGAQIMLLDTNFNHFIKENQGGMDNTASTDIHGNYSFTITYRSTYRIIAFVDGYYANLSDGIIIHSPGQINVTNFRLQAAKPDTLDIIVRMTDLDDATVTVHRTVIAASRVFRFSLDFNPQIGDSNQNVSQDEVNTYLGMLNKDGPGFKSFSGDNTGGNGGNGGPSFLEIPVEVLLDESSLTTFVQGSHTGNLTNLLGPINSTRTIYYNATFDITLDGPVSNTTSHSLNITTVFNNTIIVNITFLFNPLYNVSHIVDNKTNSTIFKTTDVLRVVPGSNDTGIPAYANITLSLNGSTVSLPIFEAPTWNIGDRWSFNQTGDAPAYITYTVNGKPLRQGEQDNYRVGEGEISYICYELEKGQYDYVYVTMSDLAWLNTTDKKVNYLVNDVDFPLYAGKTWPTKTWWNETVTATVNSTTNSKSTGNGIYSCVNISYKNVSQIVGREWFSPQLKFFVNRTRYVNHQISSTMNLTTYLLSPYFESLTANQTCKESGLYNYLNVTVKINASKTTTTQDYRIEGSLMKEREGEQPIEIEHKDQELSIHAGTNPEITFSFSGILINISGVNGSYTTWFTLRNRDTGQELDYISANTPDWNYTDFQSPPLSVIGVSDYGNDTDHNSKFNYLTVNVTIHIFKSGMYRLNGCLNKVIYYGQKQEWNWITGTGTDQFHLTADTTLTLPLNFNGQDIYKTGYDGPYQIHIEIENASSHNRLAQNDSSTKTTYQFTHFETPSVFFNKTAMNESQYGHLDYLDDTFLIVNTSIHVILGVFDGGTRTYDLHGGIYFKTNDTKQWGESITGNGAQVILHEGDNIVPMNFKACEIKPKLNDSQTYSFKVGLGISERIENWVGPEFDHIEYFTKNYTKNDFPDPAVTLNATGDYINGSYLTVNVTISTSEKGGGIYDLHTGIHWVDEEQQWHFITGAGQILTMGRNSTVHVALNYNGGEIYNTGKNGPYKVWLGLDNGTTHEWIGGTEYTTQNWSYSRFPAPGARFDTAYITSHPHQLDQINRTSGSLMVQLPILVVHTGLYRVNGGINWVDRSHGYENWMCITGTGTEPLLLTSGPHNITITLNFDQGMIRSALQNINPPYLDVLKVYAGLENATTFEHLDNVEYVTGTYSYQNFSASGVTITNTTESIAGGNLVVNLTINTSRPDVYDIHGGVHWVQGQSWWFITGNGGSQPLNIGTQYVLLTFSGREIYSNGHDGPYKLWLGIDNRTTHRQLAQKELTTRHYYYNDFSAPEVRIVKDHMVAGTADYTNGSCLTVNVSINATTAGIYKLDGGLHYTVGQQWFWITGTGREITIHAGDTGKTLVFPLNFNAGDIYQSAQNGHHGPYKVWVELRNITTWQEIDRSEYTTKLYLTLPTPPIRFEAMPAGNTSYGYINGSYFTVNLTINVTNAAYAGGPYDLHSGVAYRNAQGWWQYLTGSGKWIQLRNHSNNIRLNFNAGEIQTGLQDGYYDNLSVWIGLSNTSTWTELSHIEYITKKYHKANFPGPQITVTALGDYVNTSGSDQSLTINVTVTVHNTSGDYDVHGGINWIDNSSGGDRWMFITGVGSPRQLRNGTNNISINFNAGDIYTTLLREGYHGRLVAWIGVQNRTTWEEVAHTQYQTSRSYSSGSFNPPSLTVHCTGDYNNAHQFLTVNVTINATGKSLNHPYEIHTGLNWKENGQWQYITGYGTRIDNLTHNMTIPLNFTGGAIRSARHNGTYEVWIGISSPGNWQDLAHEQYTTTKIYHYDAFAPPVVQIIGVTDFKNDKNLTLNVTVNVNRTGTYSLEAALHWKTGFEWRFFTWQGGTITLTAGTHIVPLTFNGMQITRAAQDTEWPGGTPLVAWIAVRNTTTGAEIDRVNEYTTTHNYSRGNFMVAPVMFDRTGTITYQPYRDGELKNISLNVTVPLNITGSPTGTYKIYADLFETGTNIFITTASANISTSSHQVNVSFNGTRINDKHYNGSFEFRARIVDAGHSFEYDRITDTTGIYHYADFKELPPEATIIGSYSNYTDGGQLIINITINVNTTTRQYEVYGDLFDNTSTTYVTHAKNMTYFNNQTGHVIVRLAFDRDEINASGVEAPYNLAYLRLSIKNAGDSWEELQIKINPYTHITGGAYL